MRPEFFDKYATVARFYDPFTAFFLRTCRQRIVERCVAHNFSRVLDIGCGTGVLAKQLLAANIAVTCADSSPAMLGVAAERLPVAAPRVCSSYPLPFRDNSFDAAILALVLHESDDKPEMLLAETLRVAPVALVLEWRMPERNLDLAAQPLVHAIERLAGKEHYIRFRKFGAKGYLRGVVGEAGGSIADEEFFLAGSVLLAEVVRVQT